MVITVLCRSHRGTPFEAMFGRLAKPPVDFNTSKNYDADEKLSTVEPLNADTFGTSE